MQAHYSAILAERRTKKEEQAMSEKLVLKYAEAARLLSVGVPTVKLLVQRGRLKGVHILGGKRCAGVSAASVKALAEGGAK